MNDAQDVTNRIMAELRKLGLFYSWKEGEHPRDRGGEFAPKGGGGGGSSERGDKTTPPAQESKVPSTETPIPTQAVTVAKTPRPQIPLPAKITKKIAQKASDDLNLAQIWVDTAMASYRKSSSPTDRAELERAFDSLSQQTDYVRRLVKAIRELPDR